MVDGASAGAPTLAPSGPVASRIDGVDAKKLIKGGLFRRQQSPPYYKIRSKPDATSGYGMVASPAIAPQAAPNISPGQRSRAERVDPMEQTMVPVFIGFDLREPVAYHVCCNSIIRRSSVPLQITPLALKNLSIYRETHTDGSNEFVYSRFLVPHLMNYHGWAVFMDGDMIVRADIAELWALRDDSKAVICVQHDYRTRAPRKYLGAANADYPRKNWSSVVLWNCGHPANRPLTPEFVESASGAQLHRFSWLRDDLIGALPIAWNWLPDEFGPDPEAKLLHWTLGTPCFHDYAHAPMAPEWHGEHALTNFSAR